jgi:hypothetical protein
VPVAADRSEASRFECDLPRLRDCPRAREQKRSLRTNKELKTNTTRSVISYQRRFWQVVRGRRYIGARHRSRGWQWRFSIATHPTQNMESEKHKYQSIIVKITNLFSARATLLSLVRSKRSSRLQGKKNTKNDQVARSRLIRKQIAMSECLTFL